ncbi:MAG TPA: GH116 family glycosyl hydrolase [Pyrinomonadaceae bacterium]|nr:GH116 family glycosyl hydrolase [Pyrinomonadaceae bacterium]
MKSIMPFYFSLRLACCLLFFSQLVCLARAGEAQEGRAGFVPKFPLSRSGLELERSSRAGAFYAVTGRRAAAFGYEHRALEAWVYPLKILDDFRLSFQLEGYPLEFNGADTLVRINVRPEATTFIYSHAAFTVRQIVFAPLDEPGIVMLLSVESALPLTVNVSFRPRLRLSWPAGLMTGSLSWNERAQVYYITEESKRFAGVVGSPAARDVSVMPYQEEPRDVPARFRVQVPAGAKGAGGAQFIPIVIAGSVEGRERAKAAYDRLLANVPALYEATAAHYRRLEEESLKLSTPNRELDEAFAWAKVGVDKGVVTNPLLGTGLVAGYRTSGESERPGFAWFFGRDALWTALALNSYGDFETTRTALEFLKKFQRADGKIPHEISQSATLIPWFTDYEYPWASADATPLYVIAHADYFRASGDLKFLQANWESILRAYRFSEATDTDSNGLVENTKFGHGWVEGSGLYPAHEEIYMQGLWVAASRDLSELAGVLKDARTAARARTNAERTRAATEQTYWLAPPRGFYAFATKRRATEAPEADPGPNRAVRQARLNALKDAVIYDEDTVLPAVPLWFKTLLDERAQVELDRLGAGALATDWGARLLSSESQLYDPLSYHSGSVWPLFTGWASMAAYRYGRPHIGFQALAANALLTRHGAEGYVTELLSGDFNAPFGRSSHHQVWSEAMIVTPAVRGLLGLETSNAGRALRFAPQLPADWNQLSVRNVRAGDARYTLTYERTDGRIKINIRRQPAGAAVSTKPASGATVSAKSVSDAAATTVTLAPSLPLDARLRGVTLQGRSVTFAPPAQSGDVQQAEISFKAELPDTEVVFDYDEGTDVYQLETRIPPVGDTSRGLRLLRSRAEGGALRLLVEGVSGHAYALGVRTPHKLSGVPGASVKDDARGGDAQLLIQFNEPSLKYLRREVVVPLRAPGR